MLDPSMFQPPAPVTTVEDLLRYPTEKLVALERALPMQAVLRPVVVEALRRRGMMPGAQMKVSADFAENCPPSIRVD